MKALEQLVKTMLQQLRGFSLTAKMLMGALMVIMALALVLVAQYAGRSELVALGLGGGQNTQARARAATWMQAQSIPYEDRGDDLYVPRGQGSIVRGALTEDNAITTDQINFAALIKDSSPWEPNASRKTKYQLAVMAELERMLSSWASVQTARVQIARGADTAGFGRALSEKTATASIVTTGGPVTQELAEAVAAAVSGGSADLKKSNVHVIDARLNREVQLLTGDAAMATATLRRTKETEDHIEGKLNDFFRPQIPGIKIAVRAIVDTVRKTTRKTDVAEPVSGVGEESTLERTATNTRQPRESGVRPNSGITLATGNTISESAEIRSDTRMDNRFGHSETLEDDPGGQILRVNAIVGVPASYVRTVYADRYPEDGETIDAARRSALEDEIELRITNQVLPFLVDEQAQPGAVEVSTFLDNLGITPAGEVGKADPFTATSGGMPFVGEGIVRTGGLTLLSFVSLALMFMMVRRASRQEEMPTAEELVGIPPALAEEDSDLVGEAEEVDAAMEGVEVDEGDVRRTQMLDQINDLAKQSPDETAALVRKWIASHEHG